MTTDCCDECSSPPQYCYAVCDHRTNSYVPIIIFLTWEEAQRFLFSRKDSFHLLVRRWEFGNVDL